MVLSPARRLRRPRIHCTTSPVNTRGRHALSLPAQPTVTSKDGTRSLRLRQDGTQMPLPPVMDEKVNKARMKWELPKPDQDKANLTPFQKELQANPYARALATPIRQCQLTRALLPIHFLIPFTTKLPDPSATDEHGRVDKPKLVPAIHFRPRLASSYALAKDDVTTQLVGKKNRWDMLVSDKMQRVAALRTGKRTTKIKHDWELGAEDLREEVRDKLELVAARFLKRLVRSEQGSLVVSLPSEGMRPGQTAAVLHFGGTSSVEDDFPDVETFRLDQLLQEPYLDQVSSEYGFDASMKTAALLKHERTSWALMSLHKLQNFLRPAG